MGAADADQPHEVFEGEDQRKEPFDDVKQFAVGRPDRIDTVQHYGQDTQNDAGNEQETKTLGPRESPIQK